MKKLISLLFCTLMMVVLFVGCGQNNNQNKTEENTNKNSVEEKDKNTDNEAKYPITVTDSLGTEVVIEQKPEKMISMSLGTDELLVELVSHDNITALSGSIAENAEVSNIAEVAKNFNKVENNVETIISLNPDLVFVPNWVAKETIQQLKDAGINVYAYGTAATLEDQIKIIEDIANIVGEKDNGAKITNNMKSKLAEIEDKVSSVKEDEKVRVLAYNSYGSTNGKGTTFDDIVKKAGGINVASEIGLELWAQISKEMIIELNPDVIIVPGYAYDESNPKDFADTLLNDESLKDVNAIKNNKVYMLQEKHISSVSQYMVYGVEDLAKAIYSDLFK